jgi:D-beta-D-heptose 7-phosphate kinase/D-beta-D-heptose 1-phosphate adenosyltransferase
MANIVVLGDFMHDVYVRVGTTRMAQEANIPVWDEIERFERAGGAGNVVENLRMLSPQHFIRSFSATKSEATYMKKVRYVDENDRIIFRHDNFQKYQPKTDLRWILNQDNSNVDALVVSDYDKGSVTKELVDIFRNVPLKIVDSKRRDLSMFEGFDVLKINRHEHAIQVSTRYHVPSYEAMFKHVVVTNGPDATIVYRYDRVASSESKYVIHQQAFEVAATESKDVTGCGDTHTAALVLSLLGNGDMENAVQFANFMASRKVMMLGTGAPKKGD